MVESLKHKARALLNQGRDEDAYGVLGQVLAKDAADAEAHYLLSVIAHKYKSFHKEVEVLLQAERLAPDSVAYKVYLARAFAMAGASSLAWEKTQQINTQELKTAELLDALAVTFNRLSLYDRALEWYEKLITLDDTNPYTWFNLGTCFKYCGRFQEAKNAFSKAIHLKPNYYKARAALASLGYRVSGQTFVPELEELLDEATDVDAKLHLAHAISREFEARGEHHRAFELLATHKAAMRQSLSYDLARDKNVFSAIGRAPLANINPYVKQLENLFVVGMPRSGTTLVERILSRVPDVISGGELYHFSRAMQGVTRSASTAFVTPETVGCRDPESLAEAGHIYRRETAYLRGEGQILLDKLPLNVLYTPQLLCALEEAVVICLDRNPLDTIVGNYRQLFSFEDMAHGYSLSLTDTAEYYAHFLEMIRAFEKAYPNRFHVVNYERLVTDSEGEAKRLLKFCRFDWHPQYLDVQNNPLPVATASSVQVRDQITDHSVGRWKRYGPFLSSAKQVLSDHNIL